MKRFIDESYSSTSTVNSTLFLTMSLKERRIVHDRAPVAVTTMYFDCSKVRDSDATSLFHLYFALIAIKPSGYD